MLLATDRLLAEERTEALAVVPWHLTLQPLNGIVSSALKNKAIDTIDAAIGPNHARAYYRSNIHEAAQAPWTTSDSGGTPLAHAAASLASEAAKRVVSY